jgi:NAD-dependent aldehyde dehydrogenases
MTVYAQPGQAGAVMEYRSKYDHWINGEYVAPSSGEYFENVSPVNGKVFCEVARGNAADIDKALDAAHAAAPAFGKSSPTERAVMLNKIADRSA